jgi:predicted 3-demethylubiquinone-9 3-methyltransferase (glyoxalase superfamily)
MQKIIPFLWYEKDAMEAAKYYVEVFGEDSKILTSDTVENTPSGTVEEIAVELRGQRLNMMSAGPHDKFNDAVSFMIMCKDQAELDYFTEKLSAFPEYEQCGWVTDKWGVRWQIVPEQLYDMMHDADKAKADRAVQAMLQMKRLNIAELEKAYRGE